jgi:competence protein ComEC
VHLVVISGLHIGLVAALCTWLGYGLSRLLLLQGQLQVGRWLPSVLGFFGAGYYSLLAGFSLPSQRALIAVAVVMLARLLYRRVSPVGCLLWALLLIAIDQPLAVLGAGFWLSFLAVALLLLWFLPWHPVAIRSRFRSVVGAQFGLMVALLVPSLLYMGKASWLAPMVNIVAVPWISLVTVPLCVLASLLFSVSEAAAVFFMAVGRLFGVSPVVATGSCAPVNGPDYLCGCH